MIEISNRGWRESLKEQLASDSFKRLSEAVDSQYDSNICYPPKEEIFRALELCSPSRVKAVILGQDPYHEVGQANGLCFSCLRGAMPPSLINIYKEIQSEYPGCKLRGGDLSDWASQGVLLLNTCFSVREHEPGSHKGIGWELFVQAVLDVINEQNGVVFMLWGNLAQSQLPSCCHRAANLYLTSAHPSPLSAHRGFMGNGHFRACNEFLEKSGKRPIDWSIGV